MLVCIIVKSKNELELVLFAKQMNVINNLAIYNPNQNYAFIKSCMVKHRLRPIFPWSYIEHIVGSN